MNSFLMEGELLTIFDRRRDRLERMAASLAESGEDLLTERDAVRYLLAKGFHHIDVAILAGEARMVAFQSIVAKEMMDNST